MQLSPSSSPAHANDAHTARAADRASAPTWDRPAFDQSLRDAGRRLQSAMNQQARGSAASNTDRQAAQTARQRDTQASARSEERARADEADRARRNREADTTRRPESADDDEDRDRNEDRDRARAREAAKHSVDGAASQATKEGASDGKAQVSDEESADKAEVDSDGDSDGEVAAPKPAEGDEALAEHVKQLMLAAAGQRGEAAQLGAGEAAKQMQDRLHSAFEQIQQAIADGSLAPVEGMLSQSKQALSALVEGQSSLPGQPSAAGQPNVMANLLAQWFGERPAAAPPAQLSPSVVNANASAQPHAGGPALTGGAPASVAIEGVQSSSAGDGGSGNARTGAGASGQSQTGSQASSNPSDLNAARLARGLQSAVQQRGGSVTLRLTPPDMGTVRISLQINGGSVNAQFHTQTESARQMLNQQFSQLRHALESQGLSVERLGAQTMSSSSQQSSFQHAQQHAQQQAGQQQADASPNEGRSRGEYGRQRDDGRREEERPTDDQRFAGEAFEEVLSEMG